MSFASFVGTVLTGSFVFIGFLVFSIIEIKKAFQREAINSLIESSIDRQITFRLQKMEVDHIKRNLHKKEYMEKAVEKTADNLIDIIV